MMQDSLASISETTDRAEKRPTARGSGSRRTRQISGLNLRLEDTARFGPPLIQVRHCGDVDEEYKPDQLLHKPAARRSALPVQGVRCRLKAK